MRPAGRLLAAVLLLLAAARTAARPLLDPAVLHAQVSGSAQRRLLGAAGSSGPSAGAAFDALAPGPAAAATGPAAAPDAEAPQQQPQQPIQSYGFSFNSNFAFVGVAIVLALLVACFWGVCGAYRRRAQIVQRTTPRPHFDLGDIPEVCSVHDQPAKLTALPIIVIQPDNKSIAYTFRELESGKGAAMDAAPPATDPGGGAGAAAASASAAAAAAADGPVAAGHTAGRGSEPPVPAMPLDQAASGSGQLSPNSAADGGAGSPGVSPRSGRRRSLSLWEPDPSPEAGAASAQPGPSGQAADQGLTGRSAALQALQGAGLLRKVSRAQGRVPQMLEWDLSSALEALGVETSSGSAASLNPPLSRTASAARLARANSAAGLPRPGSAGGAERTDPSGLHALAAPGPPTGPAASVAGGGRGGSDGGGLEMQQRSSVARGAAHGL